GFSCVNSCSQERSTCGFTAQRSLTSPMVKYRLAGIGGSSALARLCSGMARSFDHCLQFLTGVESHDTSCRDRNLLACFRVAARPLWFFAQLKIAETGELQAVAHLQGNSDFFGKALDPTLRFAL